MNEYKILEKLSIHSFDNYQISVITMSDKQGKQHKGIAVSPAPDIAFNKMSEVTGNFDQPLVVGNEQALLFCHYIEEVLNGGFPKKIEVITSGPVLRLNLKKFTEKWHGGGGYKGHVSFNRFSIMGILSNITIARSSLLSLRSSLINLYKLENMAVINA